MTEFERILDDCIDRISKGETIDACLRDYPGQAAELRRSLSAVSGIKRAGAFTPSKEAKRAARERFIHARAESNAPGARPFFSRVARWPVALVATAALMLVAVLGYNALQPGISPYVPVASPQGNFVFLVTDAVNAIADFSSLDVTIDKIGLLTDSGWIEFVPQVTTIDLTMLPDGKTQAVWRGDMPEGRYSKVFIYVSSISGVLKTNSQGVEVKLPGNKIQVNTSFEVKPGAVAGFTFDLTVTSSGNPKNGPHYMLKGQAGPAGPNSAPVTVTVNENDNGKGNPHNN
jgi:hypothetical protein